MLTELFTAYYNARSNKRNTYNQVRWERNLSDNMIRLWEEIVSRRYKVGRSMCFIIEKPVKREVFAASFRDRIVHHLLYQYLVPVFQPTFIYDSYSCIPGRGTLFGIKRLEHHIRCVSGNYTRECWVLKMDLLGYFMSINRQRLMDIIVSTLQRKGLDRGARREEYQTMLYLLELVIFNEPTRGCYRKGKVSDWDGLPPSKSLFGNPPGCGLPIGNLTSQLFSNVYLNELDQYVKRDLKVKHYGRYVDDFYLVDSSRETLLSLVEPMRCFLHENLFLTLHPKKVYLQPQEKGVAFLGRFLKDGKSYMTHRTHKRMAENLSVRYAFEVNPFRMRSTLNSYLGIIRQVDHPDARLLGPPFP